ncbi:hypothetical protein ElyMa_003209500 [Elysia marginata]|uniref:Uncharacterized protein n=1 Tax=Elysia marginata TaxID=1093978 RepID=A0AAV4J0J4_9GAST|nr:hypothetical protein ElyMa_003209500 [Elysia marginata]
MDRLVLVRSPVSLVSCSLERSEVLPTVGASSGIWCELAVEPTNRVDFREICVRLHWFLHCGADCAIRCQVVIEVISLLRQGSVVGVVGGISQ